MNKKLKILLLIIIIVLIVAIAAFVIIKQSNVPSKEATKLEKADSIEVVPTMLDKIYADSAWCGSFQLVWNDMKEVVVKTDIVFNPQEEAASNLNKGEFNKDMLSDEYYYLAHGPLVLSLKEKIEKDIKEKFNQTSDILDSFGWRETENPDSGLSDYLFYSMLYREFDFLVKFDKLEDDDFGKYKNVHYFGIDKNSKSSLGDQLDVLYYNSKDDFAILANTKTDDEVIFCKCPQGTTFKEIYNNMLAEAEKYTGSKSFSSVDEFKAPNITINENKEYSQLQRKEFKTDNPEYPVGSISSAIQTIKFSINEKGGKIKSEAGVQTGFGSIVFDFPQVELTPRYFYVDDTFALFLREKGKEQPYFCGRIEDITKFQ